MNESKYVVNSEDGFIAIKQCIEFLQEIYHMQDGDCDKTTEDSRRDSNIIRDHDKYIFRGLRRAADAGIRSGAAIRLEESFGKKYTFIDYINYHKTLIENAKKMFPEQYGEKSDLDVLAEIQHNGGATCLIDFSSNFLTSLWFACGSAENVVGDEDNKDGLLYCVNLNDALVNHQIMSIITEKDREKSIENLLKGTRRFVDFEGNYRFKFWYWQPEHFNERIANQDSLFIFGLENFNIEKNKVITIRIKDKAKKGILYVLEQFFNMSITTVYPDINGYSDANGKFNRIQPSAWEGNDCLSRGTFNMLCKNNTLALDYLNRFECCQKSPLIKKECEHHRKENCDSSMISSIEMYYIRGEAYRRDNHPNRAILNYQMARKHYKSDVLERFFSSRGDLRVQKLRQRVEKRIYSTYSLELLLLYQTKRFTEGIALCQEIIDKYDGTTYNINYARISIIELTILHYHYYVFQNKTANLESLKAEKYEYCRKKIGEFYSKFEENTFYRLLLTFFDYFVGIYFEKDKDYSIERYENELLSKANSIKNDCRELICN